MTKDDFGERCSDSEHVWEEFQQHRHPNVYTGETSRVARPWDSRQVRPGVLPFRWWHGRRNLCRQRLSDDDLAACCLFGDWDSCYIGVLAAIAPRWLSCSDRLFFDSASETLERHTLPNQEATGTEMVATEEGHRP
jgi:hypothetical protein